MIYYGKNIRSTDDRLTRIALDDLYRSVHSPRPESVALIRQLRIVQQIDRQQYSLVKRQLPYFVCATFNPPFRRSENFASIEHFVIDIDHLSDKNLDTAALRQRLQADARVQMLFLSPGGDGLKVLMRLKETCYDKGLFSIFYKAFLTRFSADYGIEQVVDTRTSDVTRACFLSYDPDAYLNSEAEAVDLSAFVDTANTLTFAPQSAKPQQPARTPSDPVSQTAIENIKQILAGAKATAKAKPEAFVPQQLAEIIDELKGYIEQSGAIVRQIESIQYGKKIKTLVGAKQAETNVFYGRRGFSVVISPRTGTDAEANQLVADLIQSFFDTHT